MKKLFILVIIALLASNANAKIWRLNNNFGINADFSDLNVAYSSASAYDTIYVEGSNSNYGSLTLNKPLTIIGTGYFLTENPMTQRQLYASSFSSVTFSSGSAGSLLTGISVNNYLYIYTSDITIEKNYLYYGVTFNNNAGISNIKIFSNYIYGGINASTYPASSWVVNMVIKNNYISNYNSGYGINLQTNSSGLIINNVFNATSTSSPVLNVNNFLITNNIINQGLIYNTTYNNFVNNICNSTQLPAGNNNQLNVNMANVFLNTGSTDGRWMLKAGSPAIGTGVNGADCGMFGGDDPYVLSGIPGPSIYDIITSGIGTVNTGLNVRVKAKAH